MQIAAYCARSWRWSTWITTRVRPLTCPPLDINSLNVTDLVANVVYLRLHGLPDQSYLYGDDWVTALSKAQVAEMDFTGSVVFLEGCYGLGFAEAFLTAGASSVTGSNQPTFGRRFGLGQSSKIGRQWLHNIRRNMTAKDALFHAISGYDNQASWRVVDRKEA